MILNQILCDLFQVHMTNRAIAFFIIDFITFAEHWAVIVADVVWEILGKMVFGVGFRFVSLVFPFFNRNEEHIADRTSALLEVEFLALAFHRTVVDGTWGDSLIGMKAVVLMMCVVFHVVQIYNANF